MNQGMLNDMTKEDTITEGDVWRNTEWMAHKMTKFYGKQTFLDVIIRRAYSIIKKNVTRPQYSSGTIENIKELINELNRLKTAVERAEVKRVETGR